ncbi:MAG: hypothetical protein Q8N39_10450 [Pelolinea sp.]|nr:hypothetical protein [Pelolinea sp.]
MINDNISGILETSTCDLNDYRKVITQEFSRLKNNALEKEKFIQTIVNSQTENYLTLTGKLHNGPLQVLKFESKELRQFLKSITDVNIKNTLEKHLDILDKQSSLIRDILSSRLFSIQEGMSEIVSELQFTVREKKDVEFHYRINYHINKGEDEVSQLFINKRIADFIISFVKVTVDNALEHGKARIIDIFFIEQKHNYECTVKDNGKGFFSSVPYDDKSFQTLADNGKLGLYLIRKKISLFNDGNIEIDSHPNEVNGTIVKMTINK